MIDPDDILDSLFHGSALQAFLEQAAIERGWPDPEATRRRAFELYEEALADQNRERTEFDKANSPTIRCRQPSKSL